MALEAVYAARVVDRHGHTQSVGRREHRGFLELVPPEPLNADSPYVLNEAAGGPEQVVTFQTGAEFSDPIPGLIAVLYVGAGVYPHDGATIRRVAVSLRGEVVSTRIQSLCASQRGRPARRSAARAPPSSPLGSS